MKTLASKFDKEDVLKRLRQVQPETPRRWGKMTPHQMICHLSDSFKTAIGERQVNGDKSNLLTKTVVRWIALYAPLKWPHGVPTMAENDQERGGTPPAEFQRDVDQLEAIILRITNTQRDFKWSRHPLFAEMSERDWMRWGYLHCDHHLRQFGV